MYQRRDILLGGTAETNFCQHWCRDPTNDPAPSVGGRVRVGNLGSLLAIGGLRSGGSVAGSLATGCGLAVGGWDEACVDLGGELVDQLGQLGVGMQFQLARDEVVVGLGLLESGLPVLPDHHKGGQEYRLKRDDEGKGRPGTLLEHEHPYGEERRMQTADPLSELNRIAAQTKIEAFQMERPTLEQVFLRLTGRSLRD